MKSAELLKELRRVREQLNRLEAIAELDVRLRSVTGGEMLVKIITTAADEFCVNGKEIAGHCRAQNLVKARHAVFLLARELTDKTTEELGRFFGVDHSTVVYGAAACRERISIDQHYGKHVAALRHRLGCAPAIKLAA